jgi:hypothetical protein
MLMGYDEDMRLTTQRFDLLMPCAIAVENTRLRDPVVSALCLTQRKHARAADFEVY